jgi:hypothetical protein
MEITLKIILLDKIGESPSPPSITLNNQKGNINEKNNISATKHPIDSHNAI